MATLLQPNLFAHGPLATDPEFASVRRCALDHWSWVDVAPRWLPGADLLFDALLHRTEWESYQRWMYERWVDEPRLHGDLPRLADDLGAIVAELPMLLRARYGVEFDRGSLAYYRNGRDSVAWHGDSIGVKRSSAIVAVLSLGATRKFLLRPNGGGRSHAWSLGSGDLLVMGGACQRDWQHSVPKTAVAGPRISVQFRSPGWVV